MRFETSDRLEVAIALVITMVLMSLIMVSLPPEPKVETHTQCQENP